jgi:glycine/D-amino acid oxidase-like deaminating enzyme
LRSGPSVWSTSSRAHVSTRSLETSLKADVAIVGAGVSGALMAHALAGMFDRVVILDRRAPIHGSTMASTAMLQYEIDTPLINLSKQIGPSKAKRAWQRSWRATQQLSQLIREEHVLCGLQDRQVLYLSGDKLGHRALREEGKARQRAGIENKYLSGGELTSQFGIAREGAILSSGSASANPVQLAAGLLRRAVQAGAEIYSPVRVFDVMASSHGVVLDAGKHFIEAKHCIFCTGYELLKGIPAEGVKITSSWAIASRPNTRYPRWLDDTLIWEASDPYLYIRTTPDRRLIVGGEDEEETSPKYRAHALPRKSVTLANKLKKLIPDLEFTIAKRWAGAFGESQDGLPIIDQVAGMPNCHVVMGVGGNGTIFSLIAAQIVARQLNGHSDRDRDLFRFR